MPSLAIAAGPNSARTWSANIHLGAGPEGYRVLCFPHGDDIRARVHVPGSRELAGRRQVLACLVVGGPHEPQP